MPIRLQTIAAKLQGTLSGPTDLLIHNVASIANAKSGDLVFMVKPDENQMNNCNASAFIIPVDAEHCHRPCIRVKSPKLAFSQAILMFHPQAAVKPFVHHSADVHSTAEVHASVRIDAFASLQENVSIGTHTHIGTGVHIGKNASIGRDCIIHPNVTIYPNTVIKDRVIIHSGTTIGADGFGYITNEAGEHIKIPHIGHVLIENDVEIGANVTIDRGTLDATVIGEGTKIDNLVQIAHNVSIGKHCIIVAMTGIAGSTTVEDEVTIAAQCGIVGHVTIGKRSTVLAESVVTKDLPQDSFVSGFPARPHQETLRTDAAKNKLPELIKKVKQLEKHLL